MTHRHPTAKHYYSPPSVRSESLLLINRERNPSSNTTHCYRKEGRKEGGMGARRRSSDLWCVPIVIFLLHLFLVITEAKRDRVKSLHFSLYQHETINKTGFFIVDGVAGSSGPGVSQTTMPFGAIFVFRDNMTTGLGESSSRVAGIAEGTSITSSLDGLRSLSVAKITLDIEGHRGSVSIVGGTHNIKPSDHPVVGGTGDFLFVQGYVTSSPVDLTGVTVVYKIEFHLYWPPYAAAAVRDPK